MNPVNGILIFFLIWWVTLFAVLPLGVRGQAEENDIEKGTEPGAPLRAQMGKKVVVTTFISGVLWLIVFAIIHYGLFDWEDLPFTPDLPSIED